MQKYEIKILFSLVIVTFNIAKKMDNKSQINFIDVIYYENNAYGIKFYIAIGNEMCKKNVILILGYNI